MNTLFSCKRERKMLKYELKKRKFSFLGRCRFPRIQKFITEMQRKLERKELNGLYKPSFHFILLFVFFILRNYMIVRIILPIIFLFYLKQFMYYFILFLYERNVVKFNEIIKILKNYEHTGYGNETEIKKKGDLLILELYEQIYTILSRVINIYFFCMNNFFSIMFETNSLYMNKIQVGYSTNLKKLCYLKDFYLYIFPAIFDLKEKKGIIEKQEKSQLYKSVRNVFKDKYKKEYQYMKMYESPYSYFIYEIFHELIRTYLDFLHFLLFLSVSAYYLCKSLLFLSFYIRVLNKKKFVQLLQPVHTQSKPITERRNVLSELLSESILLLNSLDLSEQYPKVLEEYLKQSIQVTREIQIELNKNTFLKKVQNHMKKEEITKENEREDTEEDNKNYEQKKEMFSRSVPIEEQGTFEYIPNENTQTREIEREKESYYNIYYYSSREDNEERGKREKVIDTELEEDVTSIGEDDVSLKTKHVSKNSYGNLNPSHETIGKENVYVNINTNDQTKVEGGEGEEEEEGKEYSTNQRKGMLRQEEAEAEKTPWTKKFLPGRLQKKGRENLVEHLLEELKNKIKRRRYIYVKKRLFYDKWNDMYSMKEECSENNHFFKKEQEEGKEKETNVKPKEEINANSNESTLNSHKMNGNIPKEGEEIKGRRFFCNEEKTDCENETNHFVPITDVGSFRKRFELSLLKRKNRFNKNRKRRFFDGS